MSITTKYPEAYYLKQSYSLRNGIFLPLQVIQNSDIASTAGNTQHDRRAIQPLLARIKFCSVFLFLLHHVRKDQGENSYDLISNIS